MRIVVMGQMAFGAKTLEALLDKGENVVGVYARANGPGVQEDILATLAKEKGLPLRQPETYKDAQALSEFKAFSPDLLVMAFVRDIIPKSFLEVPTQRAICYHPSLLPRHRGASAINWAIIMGDLTTGLTIFQPDGGIDTGPILLKREVPIGPEDTTGSLYFNQLFPMGIDAILEAVEQIKYGNVTYMAQDEKLATYECPCDDGVAKILWPRPGQEIYDLIRGCDPQPGAYCTVNDQQIRLYDVRFCPNRWEGVSGEILGLQQDRLAVSTGDGVLEISKIKMPGAGKMKASDFLSELGIQEGHRFES